MYQAFFMVPKLDNNEKTSGKNKKLLLLAGAVVVVIVVCAVLGYLYLDDQNRQNTKRAELKQTFGDRLNETNRLYTQIGSYPAAGNKNYIDGFRKWVDGYQLLADNYSQAVALLEADGAAYKCMLANDSSDYSNVTGACIAAKDKARSVNSTAVGYEREYQGKLGMKANASAAFDQAVEESDSLYDTAWSLMQDNSIYSKYNGYLLYLKACQINNSCYNDSIDLAEQAGVEYQTYLTSDEYYTVNTTLDSLREKSDKLGKRYVVLQNTTVNVTLMDEQLAQAFSGGKLYTVVSFYLQNDNRVRGIQPSRMWNINVHFKLIDTATGAVRSECDVSVPEFNGPVCDVFSGNMECDQNRVYKTEYKITFEY